MAYVKILNPASIPATTSKKNININDGSWKVYDFTANKNTTCYLVAVDGTETLTSPDNAVHLVRNGIFEGRASNPSLN